MGVGRQEGGQRAVGSCHVWLRPWMATRVSQRPAGAPTTLHTRPGPLLLPAGMTLGLISDRGRSTIMHFSISVTYSTIALGMISTGG